MAAVIYITLAVLLLAVLAGGFLAAATAVLVMGLAPAVIIAIQAWRSRHVAPAGARLVAAWDWTPRRGPLSGLPIGRVGLIAAVVAPLFALIPYIGQLLSVGAMLVGILGVVAHTAVRRQIAAQVEAIIADRLRVQASLVTALGLGAAEAEQLRWYFDQDQRIVVSAPPRALLVTPARQDALAQLLDVVVDAESNGTRLVLRERTEDERRQQAIQASSQGLVLDVTALDGGGHILHLPAGISPTKSEIVTAWAARELGETLVEWAPAESLAVTRVVPEPDLGVRNRIAALLGAHQHEVEVEVTSDIEGISRVIVHRAPAARAQDGETRVQTWRRVMLQAIPGSHPDWLVELDDISDMVTLSRRAPRALPEMVSLESVLPASLDPAGWANLPLGLSAEGTPVGLDLTLGPHAVLVGPTGSGKTVGILALAAQQLARGHEIAIIDPTKFGVDFSSIEPFTRGFARTFAEAAALIKSVYAEGERRKAILVREQAVKWNDLDPAVRAAEGIAPLTLIIDELGSLLIPAEIPRGLAKDDPDYLEATELNAHKAVLKMYTGKIARELRFAGVHLVLALQRPDASIIGGELRSNLTSAVQLAAPGKPLPLTSIQMVFPGEAGAEAYDVLRRFDDGRSRGLAVVAGDGGDVTALRVAYSPMQELPALLEARGVVPVSEDRRFDLTSASETPADPAEAAQAIEW